MMNYKKTIFFISLLLVSLQLFAQGTPEDYERAKSIDHNYASKVFYNNPDPFWIGDTHCFLYIQRGPSAKKFLIVDAGNLSRKPAFNHQLLAAELARQTDSTMSGDQLPFDKVEVDPDSGNIRFQFNQYHWNFHQKGKQWVLEKEGKVESSQKRYWGEWPDDSEGEPVLSPDKKQEAFLKNNNLYLRNVADGSEKPLSFDGAPGDYYSNNIQWSPDSRKIAVMKVRDVEQRVIHFVEAAPDDQFQPILHSLSYTKPGDALPYRYPHIFIPEEEKQIKPDNALFKDPYNNRRLKWNADSKGVTFEYNQRGHQCYRALEIDAAHGEVRTLIEEKQKTFINYDRYFRHDLENGTEMIWMSERDNWNHLYLYDRLTGKVKHQITRGEWYVRKVIHVDESNRRIIFSANGMEEGEDPYLVRYYSIHFDGTGLACLTPEEGMHEAVFSNDYSYFVDTYSKVNMPPVTVLRDGETGQVLMEVEKADISQLQEAGWMAPEVFSAKGRDGQTDIWGVIVRPSHFDPEKKYPILEYVYAGPGSQHVPKTFSPSLRFLQSTAEIGFVVVMVDGMGTSFRSKAFEDVICKNLKDAGFPDRIAWIKAAAKKYSWMDIDRVGIFGGSAGGQNAMGGVLFHPRFYKAAYAGCGCHDNRMDKIWWNEQWMGFPVGEHYSESSNVDNAHLLTRPLMLMVGEMDTNVDPASTMQVVKALQEAGKEFELVVVPGVGHTLGGPFGDRKRYDFFLKHLWNISPPDWNRMEAMP